MSTAVAALCLHDTHTLALFAQILTAMTVEALSGTTESFHPFFSEKRPHPGQTECARNILSFLTDSKLTKINDGANSSLRQDRYSIRTAPQWLGPILEDLCLAHAQVSIECNSATDNPLTTPSGEFLHGGNFQAKAVTSAMEKARQGVQGMGRMLFAQCTELINPVTNRGLPPNLVVSDPSLSLVFKGIDINIAALAAELGFLANPVNHVQTAEMGNQALNSLALIGARYTSTANDVLAQLVAAHLVAVCQALDLRAMNAMFLEMYQGQFEELVDKHYAPDHHQFNSAILSPLDSIPSFKKALWTQLQASLDTTTHLDAAERFSVVAKSLRPVVLDNQEALEWVPSDLYLMNNFTAELSTSLQEAWCAHRDAYVAHGDATPLLGKASKAIYTFLRRTLNVPLLSTEKLRTPTFEDMYMENGVENGDGVNGTNGLNGHGDRGDRGSGRQEAPTIGSYTGAVYRAVKDGSLMKVAIDILRDCT